MHLRNYSKRDVDMIFEGNLDLVKPEFGARFYIDDEGIVNVALALKYQPYETGMVRHLEMDQIKLKEEMEKLRRDHRNYFPKIY